MSQIFFEDTYIAVIPTYESTAIHKHSMLHVFIGRETLTLDSENKGNLIILEQNVEHRRPTGDLCFFLFVDPTSSFASKLRTDYLKGKDCYSADISSLPEEITRDTIRDFIATSFGGSSFIRRGDIDKRITSLLDEIDSYKHMETRVTQLAAQMGYTPGYLTHLFKNETGVSLKRYLMLRRLEYVWLRIIQGEKITDAVFDAGFSTPSHFSDTCKKLTGISAADVLR